jgi:hypothetical protein
MPVLPSTVRFHFVSPLKSVDFFRVTICMHFVFSGLDMFTEWTTFSLAGAIAFGDNILD